MVLNQVFHVSLVHVNYEMVVLVSLRFVVLSDKTSDDSAQSAAADVEMDEEKKTETNLDSSTMDNQSKDVSSKRPNDNDRKITKKVLNHLYFNTKKRQNIFMNPFEM